jgi:5-methylcytosine-specific restriction endonuclease McrA
VVEPLAPARYKVEFTASQELRDKLKRLESLMPGSDLAAVIDAAVSEKLERVEAKRYGKTNAPKKCVEDVDTSSSSRYIPAPVKRAVCERDGNQCTYVAPDGTRYPERERLEFHHDQAYALGGSREISNIHLSCRTHNFLQAERDFGEKTMDLFRRSADRVREAPPPYGPKPQSGWAGRSSPFRTERAWCLDYRHG